MQNSTINVTTSIELSVLEMCVHVINLLFDLPLHSYIIWLIIKGTKTGIASDFFNLNLSVCEIGICLNSLFTFIFKSFWIESLIGLVYFFSGLGITGRPAFQCLICVERYLAVVHPVIFLKFKPLRYKVMCSVVAWIICLSSCLGCMFSMILFDPIYFIEFYSAQFLVFLSIQLFCGLAVLRVLKQSGPGERGREREEENHMKKRAFYLILITTVTLLFMYLPFTITGFHYILTKQYITEFTSSFFFFYFAGFVQPVLYLLRAGKLTYFFQCKMFFQHKCVINS